MAAIKAIIGEKVIGKDGKEVDIAEFCGEGKIVGLYFSAHWCPPCRMFTPELAAFYDKIHNLKNLEIVFVSRDRDELSFKEYFGTMPWLAMPFDNKYKIRDEVVRSYGIRGIPSLYFLDGANGKVLTEEGRGVVRADSDGKKFPNFENILAQGTRAGCHLI